MNITSTLTIILGVILSGCSPAPERPACAPTELAKLDTAFVAEAITACAGQSIETCEAYPPIKAKYAKLRKDWVSCQ